MEKREELRKQLYEVRMALALEKENIKKEKLKNEATELHHKLVQVALDEFQKGRLK